MGRGSFCLLLALARGGRRRRRYAAPVARRHFFVACARARKLPPQSASLFDPVILSPIPNVADDRRSRRRW